jgi:DmsE family decaheme c-type cytochrome
MQRRKWMPVLNQALFALVLSCAFLGVLLYSSRAAAQEEAKETQAVQSSAYAGSEACATCHDDKTKQILSTPHGKEGFAMRSDKGCETCHGPGQAHIDGGGDKSKIRSFASLKGDEASMVCLQCHENGNRANWKSSVHQQRNLACTTCHSIHSAKSEVALLKTSDVTETCSNCHAELKAQIQRTSHHPIREGLMTCASCHNPHGTLTPKLVKANSVNELCYTCHTEKRGPFLWEHPPVRENCLNCHAPHGSNHEKLLVQNRPWLCQSCHLDTRHPGTLYDGSNLLTSNREFARSCSNCHLAIHGSNHPSGEFFLR